MLTEPDLATILALPTHERRLKLDWLAQRWLLSDGTAMLPVDFVGRLARSVPLVDVRSAEERVGPLGHVPGSEWVPLAEIAEVRARYPADTPIVLLSRTGGERGAAAARALTRLGMPFVAVMDGGMVAWKRQGFLTRRDPEGLSREPEPPPARNDASGPLTRAQIEAHIGDPHNVRWLKMAAFLLYARASCVDGREDRTVIGTPGGDVGEFLLALAAVERVTGRPVAPERLPELMLAYLDVFGHFYIHSDSHASEALLRSMRGDPALAPLLPPAGASRLEWQRFMQAPPPAAQPLIARHLTIPGNLGCGHLRLILQHPERYSVRRELAESVVRLCFAKRWSGVIELDVVILEGGHQEGAVVNVRLASGVFPYSKVPLISPACGLGGVQIFVNHPQVAHFLREQIARFFTTQAHLAPLEEEDLPRLLAEIDRLAEVHLAATLSELARGLPIFDVVFRDTREFEVIEVGQAG